jgi:hypothetical protein
MAQPHHRSALGTGWVDWGLQHVTGMQHPPLNWTDAKVGMAGAGAVDAGQLGELLAEALSAARCSTEETLLPVLRCVRWLWAEVIAQPAAVQVGGAGGSALSWPVLFRAEQCCTVPHCALLRS